MHTHINSHIWYKIISLIFVDFVMDYESGVCGDAFYLDWLTELALQLKLSPW